MKDAVAYDATDGGDSITTRNIIHLCFFLGTYCSLVAISSRVEFLVSLPHVTAAELVLPENNKRVHKSSKPWADLSVLNEKKRDIYFKRQWSRPEMVAAFEHSTGKLRKAFLITTDKNNRRTVRSKQILEETGFVVVYQLVIPHPNKKVSNRLTHMELFRKISTDKTEPWGYIFENDIQILNASWKVNPNIISHESRHKEFMFLGLCTTEDFFPESKPKRYCGFCAHAYALTPKGAGNLLAFSLNENSAWDLLPQDMVTIRYCIQEKGFPLIGSKYCSPRTGHHIGLFYQDRESFPSTIGT